MWATIEKLKRAISFCKPQVYHTGIHYFSSKLNVSLAKRAQAKDSFGAITLLNIYKLTNRKESKMDILNEMNDIELNHLVFFFFFSKISHTGSTHLATSDF